MTDPGPPDQTQLAPGDVFVNFIVTHPKLAGIVEGLQAPPGSGFGEALPVSPFPGGEQTDLGHPSFLVDFQYKVADHGRTGIGKLRVFDPTFTAVEAILLFALPNAMMRFGWTNGPAFPFQSVNIVSHNVSFDATGVTIEITFADSTIESAVATYYRSFKPPFNPAEIVEQIFKEEGYTNFDIEPTKDFEGDKDKDNISIVQKGTTNLVFVNSILAPLSVSLLDNSVGYKLRIAGDKVIYKPPRSIIPTPKREYIFARDMGSIVKSFSPRINPVAAAIMGAEELKAISYSPQTKYYTVL